MKLAYPILPVALSILASFTIVKAQTGYSKTRSIFTPEIFAPGSISTGDFETHQAFSPSGDTLFFVKSAPDFSTWTICVSYFRNKRWISPVVAPFSGKYKDADPFVTRDGKTLYFISNRPVKDTDSINSNLDIWKVNFVDSAWSQPIHLDAPVNSDGNEYYPSISANGTIYFGSSRKGGKGYSDIYRCKTANGKFESAENLGDAINSVNDEFEPFISPDEKYLVFTVTKPNTDKCDFYLSYNVKGKWAPAEKLPFPFNSDKAEYSPSISPDGKYFFFSSTRNITNPSALKKESVHELLNRVRSPGNGLADIYQVDISSLGIKPE